jgi:ADP-ribose pyrophosphatase
MGASRQPAPAQQPNGQQPNGQQPEGQYEVLNSIERFRGRVVALRSDEVRMSDGSTAVRDIVEHPGAVGIVAIDDEQRIVLVRQYRHPVRQFLDELPAGLLDIDGEPAYLAAARELAEEAGLAAAHWHTLVDLLNSPGGSDEAVRVFLASGLSAAAPAEGFVVEDEELQITVQRVPLDEAIGRCLAGELTNAIAVAGILAAGLLRGPDGAVSDPRGLLRPADAPWSARPSH